MGVVDRVKSFVIKKQNQVMEILAVAVWFIVVVVALILFLCTSITLTGMLEIIGGATAAGLPIFLFLIRERSQTLFISFTSKYLLEKDDSYVDEVLGMIMSGRWSKMRIDPIEEFFGCLKRIAWKGNYELNRRIAEALPALFKINLEWSKDLVEILRDDWDQRWKSDNRRRTIEALRYLVGKENRFVKSQLEIREGDEIFTILAIVEVLDVWRRRCKAKEANRMFEKIKGELHSMSFAQEEIDAACELWDILYLVNKDKTRAIERLEKLKDSANLYIEICAARNVKYFSKKFPEKVLNFMKSCLSEDKHKYVRRPIAKEDSVDCLVDLILHKKYGKYAKEIIEILINDSDDIIRLATFDKVERILGIDRQFGFTILQNVAAGDTNPTLKHRAEVLLKREVGESSTGHSCSK